MTGTLTDTRAGSWVRCKGGRHLCCVCLCLREASDDSPAWLWYPSELRAVADRAVCDDCAREVTDT